MSSASIGRVGSQGINPSGCGVQDIRLEDILIRNPNFESPVSKAPVIIQKTAPAKPTSWWNWLKTIFWS